MKLSALLISLLLITSSLLNCQEAACDTTAFSKFLRSDEASYIIPIALIGYGVIGLESEQLKFYNKEIREEVNENIDDKFTIDDISQYVPFLSVYALNAMGIEGKNRFKDRTCVLGTAYAMMGVTVLSLKRTTRVKRPDGSSRDSFPSGHTATAFMGAEFVYQEYKDVSIWYGVTAYAVAAGTGIFRMYNNRHWLSDVSAGAGIGMICTKLAYLIHDEMKLSSYCMVVPYYDARHLGFAFNIGY